MHWKLEFFVVLLRASCVYILDTVINVAPERAVRVPDVCDSAFVCATIAHAQLVLVSAYEPGLVLRLCHATPPQLSR